MFTYLTSYDLHQPGRDYTDLINYLKSFGNWSKPLQSTWLIKTNLSSTQLRDNIRTHLDINDSLFIIEVKNTAAWLNIPKEVYEWIQREL